MRLKGKVAVVTGGGSGIGRATALLFAEEGAQVVVVDQSEADAQETVTRIGQMNGPQWRASVRKPLGGWIFW